MLIGYARTSTTDQQAGFDAQLRDLEAAGCGKSSGNSYPQLGRSRPQLAAAWTTCGKATPWSSPPGSACPLDHAPAGDRALAERKRVALRILSLGIDTGTASGRLILTVLGAIAEFERSLDARTPEGRHCQGQVRREVQGSRADRAPAIETIRALADRGREDRRIARRLKVHRTSVYRALRAPADD